MGTGALPLLLFKIFCWKQWGKRRIREEEETLYEHQPLILTQLQRLFAIENAQFSCMFVHFFCRLEQNWRSSIYDRNKKKTDPIEGVQINQTVRLSLSQSLKLTTSGPVSCPFWHVY